MLFTRLARTKCINGDGGFRDRHTCIYEGDGAWTECTDVGPVKCEVGSVTEGRPASFMKDTVLWKVWLVLFKVYTVKSGSVEDKWPPYTLYWNLEVVDSFNLIFWDHIFATSKYCQISSIDLCSKINKPSLLSKLWKKKQINLSYNGEYWCE